ncbi:SARP family transcriptional regulator [Acrocarpospora corrugata]|uniref:SARP family transcriptional regulator n=1 Tax=Acrocarpospora corrugata TaxID=35763 RepID=A0A5M3W9E4_9ACTN|nr:SARP family transcriptional regulator [Acrocarpospora corrugata]
MDFRILGQIQALSENGPVDIGHARERHLLAILLLTPGQPVSLNSLIDRIWDGNPPAEARSQIYPPMSRLRKRLAKSGTKLLTRSGAYVLETEPDSVDLHRFRRLRTRARTAEKNGDDEQAIRLLREAAQLSQGEPLAGLSGSWAESTRRTIEEELLSAVIGRVKLELRSGRHAELVAELGELALRHPLNGRLVAMRMLALHRSGRQTDAIELYHETKERLDDQGLSTSPELRELLQRISNNDPALLPRPRPARAPARLPRDLSIFTGRTEELSRLTAMAAAHTTAVTVLCVDGMPGVGKSALVLHLAHLLESQFPDGQHYVRLHGHDAEQTVVDAAGALRQLLREIGIPQEQIPQGLDERATLWRAQLARRRVLIILDDATSHEQISHLLPGTPGSLVLITSRRRLTGLDDALPLTLRPLPEDDATELLGRIIKSPLNRETDQVATAARLCGYLPLAITLAGHQFRGRQSWRVSDLVARLSDGRRRLTEMRGENRAITVAFQLSYDALDSRHRHAFRFLALHPGTDITVDCAAALLAEDGPAAEHLLDGLLDHHLIEHRDGRYRFHSLLGEYARSLTGTDDVDEVRAALSRLLDLYLYVCDQADRMLHPDRTRPVPEVAHPPEVSTGFSSADAAREWLEVELDNLRQVVRYAGENGWPKHAALLPHILSKFLETGGYWKEAAYLHEHAVSGWRELADPAGLARALTDLAKVLWRSGIYDQAFLHATEALDIRTGLDDQSGVAEVLDRIGQIHLHRSELDLAFDRCRRALDIRRSLQDLPGQAASLNLLAEITWHRGNYAQSVTHLQEALIAFQELGHTAGQLVTLNNIAETELQLGRAASALNLLEQAIAISPEMNRQHHAVWLNNRANVHQYTGEFTAALDYYRKSLRISQEIGDRRSEADTLTNIGSCLGQMGRDGEALIHHHKALTISREIFERSIESRALLGIGDVNLRAGKHEIAQGRYSEALRLGHLTQDLYVQARCLDRLGTSMVQTHDRERAEEHWRQALALFEILGVPEAMETQSRLTTRRRAAES